MIQVGFTGTSDGMTDVQKRRLFYIALGLRLAGVRILHEGDCIGADAEMNMIWRHFEGIVYSHPPTKTSKRAYSPHDYAYQPLPYLKRNRVIVKETDILLSAPKNREVIRSGTWSTIRYGISVGKPVVIVYPDGVTDWTKLEKFTTLDKFLTPERIIDV